MILHSLADDWKLNAQGDTDRSPGVNFPFSYYLTDTAGNRLTDPSGNYLTGSGLVLLYPQILNVLPDDFRLNAEQ